MKNIQMPRMPMIFSISILIACGGDSTPDTDGGIDASNDSGLPEDASPNDSGTDASSLDAGIDASSSNAGMALEFDGDDYVRIQRQVGGDFTLEAWIKTTTSRSGGSVYGGLGLICADIADSHDDFATSIANDHFAFGTGNPNVTIESTTSVTTGAWVHVAAVREMSTGVISIYVNGVSEISMSTGNTSQLFDSTSMDFGGNALTSRFFVGQIDEIRIWNVARTGEEIASSMGRPLVGTEPGLVNYYRFDDGSGAIAADSAGTNDGVLNSNGTLPMWVVSTAPI